MSGAAKAYFGLFRMRLIRGLSYRAAAIAGACTQFFWGFMLVSVLQAFARAGASPSTTARSRPTSGSSRPSWCWSSSGSGTAS